MARKEFNWVDIDKNKLPKTKGKRIDGFRFYDVDGKHYPLEAHLVHVNADGQLAVIAIMYERS